MSTVEPMTAREVLAAVMWKLQGYPESLWSAQRSGWKPALEDVATCFRYADDIIADLGTYARSIQPMEHAVSRSTPTRKEN